MIETAEKAIEKYKSTLILCLPPRDLASNQMSTPRRGKFYYYRQVNKPELRRLIRSSKEYQDLATSMLFRRGEIRGTSVVNVPVSLGDGKCTDAAVEAICEDMRASRQAEVVIDICAEVTRTMADLSGTRVVDKEIIKGPPLNLLGVAHDQDNFKATWDAVKQILEEWQGRGFWS